jgi:myo-inositol-1(or 4)-monophosphatase
MGRTLNPSGGKSQWQVRRSEVAVRIAGEAGALAMRLRPAPGAAQGILKGRQDWLTPADEAVERLVARALATSFPEDGFRGEETGPTRSGSLTWVVDPIDGTSNYARGGSRFCVSIGLLEGDLPVAGVLVAPALGEAFSACAGGGAFLNGAPNWRSRHRIPRSSHGRGRVVRAPPG